MADYEMIEGNTADNFSETLSDSDGVVDVSAGTLTVRFRDVKGSTVLTYTGAGVTGTALGVIEIDWAGTIGSAAPTKGSYIYQIEHDDGAGNVAKWPTDYNGKPARKTAVVHEALG